MRQAIRWMVGGVLVLGTLGSGQPAGAVPLADGSSITVGDATITVDSCSLCGTVSGELLELVQGPGPYASFTVDNSDGSPFVSATGATDLTVTFEVTTTTSDIGSIGLSATGTSSASIGESIYDAIICGLNSGSTPYLVGNSPLTFNLASGYSECGDSPGSGNGERDLFITKDIAANTGSVLSVTQTLIGDAVPTPEPASSTIFAVGLLGLAAARRRAR